MKIALCFSGQPRFISNVSNFTLENVIGRNNVDIFGHFWFDDSLQKNPYKYGGDGGWVNQRIDSSAIDDFLKIYQPKLIKTEESKKFNDQYLLDTYQTSVERYKRGSIDNPLEPDFRRRDINNIISYYYSLNQVGLLKSEYEYANNFKYDVVIKMRTDTIVHNKLSFELLDENSLYYSDNMNQPDGMINDWLNYGKSEVMDIFMSSFSFLNVLIREAMDQTGGSWCCELLHKKMLDKYGIIPRPLNISLELPRF
jgi:hypothetical protein